MECILASRYGTDAYVVETFSPNDQVIYAAFAPTQFETVDEFLASLEERGIINGTGAEIIYPGPGQIDEANVTGTEPGGPAVGCAPV